jgi:hypothetical protein
MCNKSTQTRLPYLFVMALGVVMALVVRYTGDWVINLYWYSFEVCSSQECYGQEGVYRISSAMCVFFGIHALCMLGKATRGLHYKWWCFKILLLVVLILIFFLIPNSPFDVYGMIARVVSAIFLVLQIIILIEFAYSANEWLLSDEHLGNGEGATKWYIIDAGCAFLLYGASVVVCVFCFLWFTSPHACGLETAFIVVTILLTVGVTAVSILFSEHGNILASGVLTLYSFYLCYSSLTSDPSSCNSLASSESTAQVVIGIAIAAVAVSYAGWNLSNASTIFGIEEEDQDEHTCSRDIPLLDLRQAPPEAEAEEDKTKKPMAEAAGDASGSDLEKGKEKEERKEPANNGVETAKEERLRKRDLKFHVVMAACCMYMAMVITSWGTDSTSGVSASPYDLSQIAMWIKIASQWMAILLYLWTLIAPRLFPDREFS